ncbi:hypothetical protein BBW65_03515 [Helicobacter enhydrae]|uniref:Uncharacterized protein n=1 Tax=Helicobacter enhydrae TaxID=222136 RepID=A0A1B1U549_9HELI|nr:hypothetical protein BBW65_03515 [Helicobacter enhydrae]
MLHSIQDSTTKRITKEYRASQSNSKKKKLRDSRIPQKCASEKARIKKRDSEQRFAKPHFCQF